ncbi:hypothetical protein [Azospirillum sp. ST 5-10]|uniref:hypothetical protein n=1 Tax=unclassified Azospirillum TaxID=2630922 RepID=UPI003F49D40A
MKAIIERIDPDKVSEELARRGFHSGQAVRVTVETVDDTPLEVGDLLHAVRRLGGETERLSDDTLDEILRDVDGGGS